MIQLPIEQVLSDLTNALQAYTEVVLQAPPGAGKTTRVPPALLGQDWLADQRIVMLEPRRLAARAAASFMSRQLGEEVGGTVGYRVRLESRVSKRTRIEVVTEGILTRFLQSDPSLDGIGCVIFDEFHERSLQADLGLALTLDARQAFRPDLRLIVMSATLDGARVAELLGDAPVVSSEGRSYPVGTRYLNQPERRGVESAAAAEVRRAIEQEKGDVLVFLPGIGEIRRTADQLKSMPADVDLHQLHGSMRFADQDRAIAPSPPGQRKVVLATDIAETSLTIEGVRVVIDAGLERAPLFDAASGMTRLVTRPASLASADQRRGRAGRVGPGICSRLWTKTSHAARSPFSPPEITQADLAPLMLDLVAWGTPDPAALRWLDAPDPERAQQALELLTQLGVITPTQKLTAHGDRVAELGVHPRIGHMLLKGADIGLGGLACDLAALLEDRDPFHATGPTRLADISLRLQALGDLRASRQPQRILGFDVDYSRLRRLEKRSRDLRRKLRTEVARLEEIGATGELVACAYPDRVAQALEEGSGRFRLRNGRPVQVHGADPLADSPFLAVAEVGGRTERRQAFLAAPLSREEIERLFADQIEEGQTAEWDGARVTAYHRRSLGAVVLGQKPVRDPDADTVGRVLLEEVARRGLHLLPWSNELRQLQNRLGFLRSRGPDWPDRSDAALAANLVDWLLPFVRGVRSLPDLKRVDLREALLADLDWSRRQELDRRAPTHLKVPSGSNIRLDYADPAAPVLAVRLQEVFGLSETPRIDGVPVVMHRLSPAQRPVQVTRDLAGFWTSSYFDVRKDMRGRYPKHHWPEDPSSAAPTARSKRRK